WILASRRRPLRILRVLASRSRRKLRTRRRLLARRSPLWPVRAARAGLPGRRQQPFAHATTRESETARSRRDPRRELYEPRVSWVESNVTPPDSSRSAVARHFVHWSIS